MTTLTKYNTITGREANEQKVVPITRGYSELEYEMLDRAIATLGDKPYVLVDTIEGIIIARPSKEVNVLKDGY